MAVTLLEFSWLPQPSSRNPPQNAPATNLVFTDQSIRDRNPLARSILTRKNHGVQWDVSKWAEHIGTWGVWPSHCPSTRSYTGYTQANLFVAQSHPWSASVELVQRLGAMDTSWRKLRSLPLVPSYPAGLSFLSFDRIAPMTAESTPGFNGKMSSVQDDHKTKKRLALLDLENLGMWSSR